MVKTVETKKWYTSKTIWINTIGIFSDLLLRLTGHGLPEGVDVIILGVINLILRFVTKSPVEL